MATKKHAWVEPKNFIPKKISEVELSQPLEAISALDSEGKLVYDRAMVLVRLHGYPLGLFLLDFDAPLISEERLAALIWSQFSERINKHLCFDGLQPVNGLSLSGFKPGTIPGCQVEIKKILQNAHVISIIISTRDRAVSLAKTLDSILALDYPNYEVILVDNAPKTRDTHDVFLKYEDRFSHQKVGLRYIQENTPGLAVAHNRGLEEVKGSIVAFTDDDVVVDKNWLAEILRGFHAAENVGCVTGLVIPSELRTPAQVLFEEFGGFTKGFDQHIYDQAGNRPKNPLFPYTAGRFGTGANMAFKTELLHKTGGFDPALGIGTPAMGGDDIAAFFEVIIQGYQLVYQPSALVHHQHRDSYEGLRRQMYGYGIGLSAFLTKCVIDNPQLFFDFASKIPAGFIYVFDPSSAKNKYKSRSYPRDLELIERKGMFYGPLAYLTSRWRYRKARRSCISVNSIEKPTQSQSYPVGEALDSYQEYKSTKQQ